MSTSPEVRNGGDGGARLVTVGRRLGMVHGWNGSGSECVVNGEEGKWRWIYAMSRRRRDDFEITLVLVNEMK